MVKRKSEKRLNSKMRLKILGFAVILAILILILISCPILTNQSAEQKDSETLFQVSTIDALLAGVYDGEVTIRELKKYGDTGIGTFNALDGELIALDGEIYKMKANGEVEALYDSEKTPFAVMTFFKPDLRITLNKKVDYTELKEYIDRIIQSKNIFYAIRIDGTFDYVKARSVPKQEKPYPKLADVVENQSIFEFENVEGTIIGFRSPEYVQGINVPGYHLHFITKDKTAGGHLLEVDMEEATIQLDYSTGFYMKLPKKGDFYDIGLDQDKQEELQKVEK